MSTKRSFWKRAADNFFGYDFFVSYAHSDGKVYAEQLARKLSDHGFDTFLDTNSYAKGDDWKIVGHLALKRTSRLVLVATSGALASKPVLRELEIFTREKKRIIPIEFEGNPLQRLDSEHPVLRYINESVLRLTDASRSLISGPSDSVVMDLVATFKNLRQSAKRQRSLKVFAFVLASCLIAAVWQAMRAEFQSRQASGQLAEANWQAAKAMRTERYGIPQISSILATHHLLQAALAHEKSGDGVAARNALVAAKLTGGVLKSSIIHQGLSYASYRPDGKEILTSGSDGNARIWSTEGSLKFILHHGASVAGAYWCPRGNQVVTWSVDGAIRFWQSSGEPDGGSNKSEGGLAGVETNVESEALLAWSGNGDIQVWTLVGRPKIKWKKSTRRGPSARRFSVPTAKGSRLGHWTEH